MTLTVHRHLSLWRGAFKGSQAQTTRTIGVYNIVYLLLTTLSVTGKNADRSGRGLLYHVTSLLDKR